MLYSINTITADDWFGMLASQDKGYVFELNAKSPFLYQNRKQSPGIYYAKIFDREALSLKKVFCKVNKLSFSQIVHISDLMNSSFIVSESEMKKWMDEGNVEKLINSAEQIDLGLEKMRDKIKAKYFTHGIRALLCRFFSAVANFFRKYNLYKKTGIYWPGNSCSYVDKVIKQNKILKQNYLNNAFNFSKKCLSESLGISISDLENLSIEEITTQYKKKALQLHPDKNSFFDIDKFENFINTFKIFKEFTKLIERTNKKRGENFLSIQPKTLILALPSTH